MIVIDWIHVDFGYEYVQRMMLKAHHILQHSTLSINEFDLLYNHLINNLSP